MALLPPHFLDSLVALEEPGADEDFRAVATGVLIGFDLRSVDEEGDKLYKVGLVTCRHVFEGKDSLLAKFNKGTGTARYRLELKDANGGDAWRTHGDFDVAVVPIDVQRLRAEGAEFSVVTEDTAIATVERMKQLGAFGGDDVYVLGFPMGLAGTQQKYAIVRGGVIARLDDEVISHERAFWIDAAIYPGNSGGPVVLRPTVTAIEGTSAINAAYVIGIVGAYIPYIDVAVSQQSKRPRITFEENSGLATVAPMDAVLAAFAGFMPTPSDADQEEGEVVPGSEVEG